GTQRGRRPLRRLSHGPARYHRDGPVPPDPVPGKRGSQRHLAGRQRAAAPLGRARSVELTLLNAAKPTAGAFSQTGGALFHGLVIAFRPAGTFPRPTNLPLKRDFRG